MSNQLTVKIQMILHATENFQKITNSFFDMFGIKENEISIQNITGHFGNPISMLGLEIKNKSTREFIKKLVSMIPQDQMIGLLENIEDYIQDSSLYLRFSKQHFIKKTLILEEKDPLKIIVHTPVYVRKEIIDAYKNLLETK